MSLSPFKVDGSRRLADEIQSAFSDVRSFWDAFQRRLMRSNESRTTLTREDWMVKLFEVIGFDHLRVQRASAEAGGETYFISHRAGFSIILAPEAGSVKFRKRVSEHSNGWKCLNTSRR
jgi:hypothetical protein